MSSDEELPDLTPIIVKTGAFHNTIENRIPLIKAEINARLEE